MVKVENLGLLAVPFNPILHMPILGFSTSAANKRYDVKNIDKWGHNFLIG